MVGVDIRRTLVANQFLKDPAFILVADVVIGAFLVMLVRKGTWLDVSK